MPYNADVELTPHGFMTLSIPNNTVTTRLKDKEWSLPRGAYHYIGRSCWGLL